MRTTDQLVHKFQILVSETANAAHVIRWNKRDCQWAITFVDHYTTFGIGIGRGKQVRLTDESFDGMLEKAVEWIMQRERLPFGYRRCETKQET